MNKIVKYVVYAAAVSGLGLSMPSCPGQQAMQTQLDSLQTAQADMTKKVTALETQVKTLNQNAAQVTQAVQEIAGAVQAQKASMDQLNTAVKELQARASAPAPAKKAPPKKKGRR
jgi:septal ring factor EnvC (AmiA/AmiB activator)